MIRYLVQGEAGQLVVELLDPKPGDHVLDACAAPGVKTTHIAARIGPNGRVLACDVSAERLTRARENGMLVKADNISFLVVDMAGSPPTEITREFDRVLVDAPCSTLGELRKSPDARYRKRPEEIPLLSEKQRNILENAARFVRPGGVLVYATCTLTRVENEGVVELFAQKHPEFTLENAGSVLGQNRAAFVTDHGDFLAAPHLTGTGGMFAARFSRKQET